MIIIFAVQNVCNHIHTHMELMNLRSHLPVIQKEDNKRQRRIITLYNLTPKNASVLHRKKMLMLKLYFIYYWKNTTLRKREREREYIYQCRQCSKTHETNRIRSILYVCIYIYIYIVWMKCDDGWKKSKSTKKKVKLLHYNVIIDKQPIKIVYEEKKGSARTLAKPNKENKAAHETDKWRAKCSHCQSTYCNAEKKHYTNTHRDTLISHHITIAWQLPSIDGPKSRVYMLLYRTWHTK